MVWLNWKHKTRVAIIVFTLIILSIENESAGSWVANSNVFRGQTGSKRDQVQENKE